MLFFIGSILFSVHIFLIKKLIFKVKTMKFNFFLIKFVFILYYLKKKNININMVNQELIAIDDDYMAPELSKIQNDKINWEKCDVYSLGMTLLELSSLERIQKLKEMTEEKKLHWIKTNIDSEYLKKILPKMIKNEAKNRASFLQLSEKNIIEMIGEIVLFKIY